MQKYHTNDMLLFICRKQIFLFFGVSVTLVYINICFSLFFGKSQPQ